MTYLHAHPTGVLLFVVTVISFALLTVLQRRARSRRLHEEAVKAQKVREAAGIPQLCRSKTTTTPPEELVALAMRVVVTVLILGAALYIVLSQHNDAEQAKWAYGSIGTILGYWLKS